MCRLLGWASQTSTTLHDLLGNDDLAEFTELSMQHGDGWGVARSTGRGVSVRKRPDPARTSVRFDRWARAGVWRRVFEALQDPDTEWLLMDSTVIRAHPCAAGAKKRRTGRAGRTSRPSAAAGAGSGPRRTSG